MTRYAFGLHLAIRPSGGAVAGARFYILPAGATDVGAAVPIWDLAGVPITALVSDAAGLVPAFATEDVPSIVYLDPVSGYRSPETSGQGLLEAAQAAAAAAQDSAAKALRLGRPGGRVPTWWGAFTAATAPTAAEGAQPGDLGILLP